MVWPPFAMVIATIADLRARPDRATELVDQVHYHEQLRVLASRDAWHYVQAEDHYFGWVASDAVTVMSARPEWRVVSVALAAVHREPDRASAILGLLPAGSPLAQHHPVPDGPWARVQVAAATGYVSFDDAVVVADLAHRPPTADDLLKTAEAFLGVPYLWGGTTALGMDCSGFVQQVYRLNGIRLDRDAHQQAMEGRPVDVPTAGDLIFFGTDAVTHVGLAVNERTFINAPQAGTKVRYDELPAGRTVRAIRRYLP